MLDLNDPQFWVAISFILFLVLFGNFIWKKLSSFLDNKINDISNEINDANNIHNEAKILLSSETKKFQDLENRVNDIINEGKLNSQKLFEENKKKIDIEIKKLENSSAEKINYVEKQAIADLQTKIINLAVNYTEEILIKNSNSSSQENIINNSIDEIKKSLDSKDNFI